MARYIVADDLTGACDAALAFARRGARALVWLDARALSGIAGRRIEDLYADADASARRPEDEWDREIEIFAIDLDSRELSAARAHDRMTALLVGLRPATPADVVQKIDSTLRGNFASETCASLAAFPHAIAIVAPSYPPQGRTIRGGVLYERGKRIDATGVGELFGDVPTRSIDLLTIRAGGAAVRARIAALGMREPRVAIADAENDADLYALAHAVGARDDVLWVGSAGIIEALAAVARGDAGPSTGRPERAARMSRAAPAERVLFLIGSRTATTREQIENFRPHATTEMLDADALARGDGDGDGKTHAAIARVAVALDRDGVALVAIGPETQADGLAVRTAFVAAIAGLVRERASLTIVLSGGAIARSFCDTIGIVGLELRDEVAPGMPRSRAIGAPLWVVTKAGGFGTPHAYREVLASLRERSDG